MTTDRRLHRGLAAASLLLLVAACATPTGVTWTFGGHLTGRVKKIRRLPVLDDNKRLVGMLSLGDIAHCASPQISAETLTAVSAHHA